MYATCVYYRRMFYVFMLTYIVLVVLMYIPFILISYYIYIKRIRPFAPSINIHHMFFFVCCVSSLRQMFAPTPSRGLNVACVDTAMCGPELRIGRSIFRAEQLVRD